MPRDYAKYFSLPLSRLNAATLWRIPEYLRLSELMKTVLFPSLMTGFQREQTLLVLRLHPCSSCSKGTGRQSDSKPETSCILPPAPEPLWLWKQGVKSQEQLLSYINRFQSIYHSVLINGWKDIPLVVGSKITQLCSVLRTSAISLSDSLEIQMINFFPDTSFSPLPVSSRLLPAPSLSFNFPLASCPALRHFHPFGDIRLDKTLYIGPHNRPQCTCLGAGPPELLSSTWNLRTCSNSSASPISVRLYHLLLQRS